MTSLADSIPTKVRELQNRILETTVLKFFEDSVPSRIQEAFLSTPRHEFVPRFLVGETGIWSDISESSLGMHLDFLYADSPICIHRDDDGEVVSTISQPSLVLFMLDLLDLQPGQKVFELGGGSGWNAAMMGRLVEPSGRVCSLETIQSLTRFAQRQINDHHIQNVNMIHGDGLQGFANEAPFDRGMFTASAWGLPRVFFEQIKDGGLLVFVMKLGDNEDLLTALRKDGPFFKSEVHFPCRFVPAIGEHDRADHHTVPYSEISFLKQIQRQHLEVDDLDLTVYPIEYDVPQKKNAYLFKRGDCKIEWSLA